MDIKAFKMDGLGNDFVIIDQRNENIKFSKDTANLTFLRKRDQTIIEVQKVNK